jgi:hypothetical protein
MSNENLPQTDASRLTPRFLVLAGLFIAFLVASNIIAVKLISVFGLVLPAAVVIFPVTYLFGDVLTEVYGYRKTRMIIWMGFGANLIVVGAILLAGVIPAAPIWTGQPAYTAILGQTPRLLLGSFTAYLVGEFLNSMVLSRLKLATKGRWLWTRTIGSTLIGQGADSAIFISIAFAAVVPSHILLQMILTQWLFKVAYEIAATPLTYLIVGYLKRSDRVDAFDYNINLNPLRVFET